LKILVYEYISGGGYAGEPIPVNVLPEGFSMLRTIVSAFKMAGHQITVLLDSRISELKPPLKADWTIPVIQSGESIRFLTQAAGLNDAVYIIAPETKQILYFLVGVIEKLGVASLNCEAQAIQKVSDKAVLYKFLKNKSDLPMPNTLFFRVYDDLAQIKQAIQSKLSYPLVFKPSDGVSCGGLSLVNDTLQIEKAIEKIKAESSNAEFIVQEHIYGEAASVSLLCNSQKVVPISLNKQNIILDTPDGLSSYEGGCVLFNHPLKNEAFKVAKRLAFLFSGLRGYVGVDLILTKQKAFVIDVNPRLTTSFIGLSKVARTNIARGLLNSISKEKISRNMGNYGFSCFSKIEVLNPTENALKASYEKVEVISPPFPMNNQAKAYAMVAGYGDSLEDAGLQLEEAKRRFLHNMLR
jgi:tyramine---L-glutamate ligase